jgi:tRNA A-37 threonylcarbamoyl transferase component Bud32
MRVLGGKYRLIRQIAAGGMGNVWLCEHVQLGTSLAVKVMTAQSIAEPVLRTRFEREARSAAQLKGPNVVTVHDFGIDDDKPYIAMELLEGEDLGARLRKVGVLSPPLAAAIVDGVTRALERAHELGIVHRDIKASNVFLAREGESEIVKVLDFGVAKSGFADVDGEGDITSTTDAMIGSPSYMSPEQIRSAKTVDHRTDLWALSVLAYRMLTGQLPFQGEGRGDLLVRICTDGFPPARDLLPTLPATLDAFFTRALAKAPAARFQSARELSVAFSAALGLPPSRPFGALPENAVAPSADRQRTHGVAPAAPVSWTGTGPVAAAGTESGTFGAGSLASAANSSIARNRQASLASIAVVGAALCLGLVAAFFMWKGNGADPARAPAIPASQPAAPSAEAVDAPAAVPDAPSPPASPAASSSGLLLELDELPTNPAPSASAAAAPKAVGAPPGAARSKPASAPKPAPSAPKPGKRIDLGL